LTDICRAAKGAVGLVVEKVVYQIIL
jgi:hypothetical protein